MTEKEITRYLELEDVVFPKDYIENIQYIPDNQYFTITRIIKIDQSG